MTDKKKSRFPFDFGDLASATGAGLLLYGAYLVYPPATYILAGLALLAVGISVHRHKPRS